MSKGNRGQKQEQKKFNSGSSRGKAEAMNNDYYFAEIARFNANGFGEGRCWGFYVSPKKYDAFNVNVAKEILEWGTEEFRNRFREEIDFNLYP